MLNDYRFHAGQFSVLLCELTFTGSDVKDFLQNQSTFDIDLLSENSFHLVSFLDPQGRLECYGWIVLKHNQYSYLVPKELIERTLSRLNKFLISEDVIISDPLEKKFHFVLGPEVELNSPQGILFDERAYLASEEADAVSKVPASDVEKWRALTGWPSFDGSDFNHELFNNIRLYDLSLASNKGCYPGQETVAKIATRRGAAYSPVLIETTTQFEAGEISSFDKRMGTVSGCYSWNDRYYLTSQLLRDFRVEGMKIHFILNGTEADGIVRYYPLIHGDNESKARELYDQANENFKRDELVEAEKNFRKAINFDPQFADAYESLGVMLGRLNRYEEAIALMQDLSRINPKSVLAHTNMSLFLMKLGKIPEAEEQKSLATVKSFQSFGDEAKNKEAETLRKQKQQDEWAQRESMFKQVLEIDAEDTLANYGLGSIAVEKQEWQKAREHLERVLKQDPKYSVAYLALGKALKGLGLKDEAKKVWEEGIKVSAAKGDLMPANQMQQELSLYYYFK